MMKFGLAVLAIVAAPALAQQAQPAPSGGQAPPQAPTPAIQQAAQAHGQCIRDNLGKLAATVTPEAGASTVFGACASQRQAVKEAFHAWIATKPQEQQAAEREQINSRLDGMEKGLANMIRQQRGEAPAAAPAPAPAQ